MFLSASFVLKKFEKMFPTDWFLQITLNHYFQYFKKVTWDGFSSAWIFSMYHCFTVKVTFDFVCYHLIITGNYRLAMTKLETGNMLGPAINL